MQNMRSGTHSAGFIESLCAEYQKHNQIDPAYYERYRVKRGLRNADGTGVMAGRDPDRQRPWATTSRTASGSPCPASSSTAASTWRS